MRFFKSAAILGASQVAGIGLTLVSRIVLGRILGTEFYGQFGVALNAITVASRGLSGGLAPAIQYEASRPDAEKQKVLGTAVALGLMATLLSTWALVLLKPWILSVLLTDHPASGVVFNQMVNWFPIVIFTMFLAVVLVPFGRVREYGIVQAGANLPFLLAALGFSAAGWGAIEVALWAQVVAWIVMFSVVLWGLRGALRGLAYDPATARTMLSFAAKAWPNTLLFVGVARIATVVGAGFMTEIEASWFVAALNLAEGILSPHSALGQLILSRAANKSEAGLETTLRVLRLSLPAFGILILVALLAGHPLLWLFGAGFVGAYPVLLVLLITGCAHALVRVYANFFAGRGAPNRITGPLVVEFMVLLGGVILLGPRFGLWGVVAASASAALLSWALSIHKMSKTEGCSPRQQLSVTREDIDALLSAIRGKRSPAEGVE